MRSPTTALLWEIWLQHRGTVAVIAVLTVAGRLLDLLDTGGRAGAAARTPSPLTDPARDDRVHAPPGSLQLHRVHWWPGTRRLSTAAVHAAGDVAPSRDGTAARGHRVDRAPVSAVDGHTVQGRVREHAVRCRSARRVGRILPVGSVDARTRRIAAAVRARPHRGRRCFSSECCRRFPPSPPPSWRSEPHWQRLWRALPSLRFC